MSEHICRESENPRLKGTCACGKKMSEPMPVQERNDYMETVAKEGKEEYIQSMREFDTGATRDGDEDKLDYEGFLSPLVVREFAAYMHKHRVQSDGTLRDSDNWQKGIPLDAYMKSMFRHFMEVWLMHRQEEVGDMHEALCALLFNVQGYLHELLRDDVSDPGMGYE